MVGDACLSHPRDYGGDMVIEAMYSIRVVGSIALCLLDVVFLGAEELMLLEYLPPGDCTPTLACHFEVLLPTIDLEESPTRTTLSSYVITRMKLLCANIPFPLFLIHTSMFLLAMCLHQT